MSADRRQPELQQVSVGASSSSGRQHCTALTDAAEALKGPFVLGRWTSALILSQRCSDLACRHHQRGRGGGGGSPTGQRGASHKGTKRGIKQRMKWMLVTMTAAGSAHWMLTNRVRKPMTLFSLSCVFVLKSALKV